MSPMERNRPAKQIIEQVEYTRDGSEIDIREKFR